MLSVIMLSDIMLSVIMLSVIMLSVIMLSVIVLNVVAPGESGEERREINFFWTNLIKVFLAVI
jgi:hypothetical protein